MRVLFAAAALAVLSTSAFAETPAPQEQEQTPVSFNVIESDVSVPFADVRIRDYEIGRDDEDVAKAAFKGVEDLVNKDNTAFSQAGGEEYLAFHLITETMLQKGGKDWKTWFPTVRDKIVGVQNQDGSWTGHHCITSRTFCTAAACLVLSSPNRYLPISQG